MVSGFNLDNLLNHLRLASENLDDIHYLHFSEAMIEYTHSFSFLGVALSMAFSDISTKAQFIQNNFKNSDFTGLQSMILNEISRGVEKNNNDRNPSTARTVLRLLWFFDFLKDITTNLVNHEDWPLAKSCRKAYKSALAPHHPWHIRFGAKIAIKTVPSRKEYMDRVFGNRPYSEQLAMFQTMLDCSNPIRETLWNFYKQHKLTELP